MTRLILILALAALMLGCSGDDKSTTPSTVDLRGYPSTIGSRWTYQRIDSAYSGVDTNMVAMSITDTTTINGVTFATLTSNAGQCISNLYVSFRGDTVYVQNAPDAGSIKYQAYVFPLQIGTACRCEFPNDSVRVLGIEKVVSPAGTFRDAYVVQRELVVIDSYLNDRIWFVPGIGIVKREMISDEYSMGTTAVYYSWTLLDYEIAE